MRFRRILLVKDNRTTPKIQYKELQRRHFSPFKPNVGKIFVKTFNLYDPDLETMRKQTVFYKIVTYSKRFVEVEVI